MPTIPVIYLAIAMGVLALVIVVVLIWVIRAWLFKPTADKAEQLRKLNALLEPSGFAYEPKGDYFFSQMNCWQRKVGYCRLYDEAAPFFNMIMDCEPIPFEYGGKRWLIELWKGQYGITSGAEIGVYNTNRADVDADGFKGPFYEAVSDDEMLGLSFVFRRDGKRLIKRKQLHWWLTGFALGTFSEPSALTMDARIKFPNSEMRDAFVQALGRAGYGPDEYRVRLRSVVVHFTKPHTEQPAAQLGPQRLIAQGLNRSNCALYLNVTSPYTDTLDRLEFLMSMAPNLVEFLLNSLYSTALFKPYEALHAESAASAPVDPPARQPMEPPTYVDGCQPCDPCDCDRYDPPCGW